MGILKVAGTKYVLTANDFLQYYIIYFSGKQITAIGKPERTRLPDNIRHIKNNYFVNPSNFAIMGFNFNNSAAEHFPVIRDKIWLLLKPPSSVLKSMDLYPPDFEIPDH